MTIGFKCMENKVNEILGHSVGWECTKLVNNGIVDNVCDICTDNGWFVDSPFLTLSWFV